MFAQLEKLGKYLGQAANLTVGVPDYMKCICNICAPRTGRNANDVWAFFRERQRRAMVGSGVDLCVFPLVLLS